MDKEKEETEKYKEPENVYWYLTPVVKTVKLPLYMTFTGKQAP